MIMKDGKPIPKMLLESLEKDIYALKVFMSMSETYQKLCVQQIHDRQYGESMRERVEKTLKGIHQYGVRNNIAAEKQ